jgi:transcriptional regulator with XRE-family HTH domain
MATHRSAAVAERLGANLHRVRRREGLSQEELAVRASLHRVEVGVLEHGGRVCRIDTLIRLAGAMAVPPAELLDGTPGFPRPSRQAHSSSAPAPFDGWRSRLAEPMRHEDRDTTAEVRLNQFRSVNGRVGPRHLHQLGD